jgi:3-oxoacyl-[acyl-carrier protein] reductase
MAAILSRSDRAELKAAMLGESGLAGKTIIISGGSRGIGRAIVRAFLAEGSDVTFFYKQDEAAAQEVMDSAAEYGGRIAAERVDVTDAESCASAVKKISDRTARIDVLINNSGIVRDNVLGLLDDQDISAVINTNVGGVFNLTRAVVPYMISQRAGKIVNIGSIAGQKGGRGQTNYAASKGAVDAFTRALAVELAPRKINVNCVAPGVIETEMSAEVRERAPEEIKSRILMRRAGSVSEVAYAVVFLASRFADYITGHVLNVDGGFKME